MTRSAKPAVLVLLIALLAGTLGLVAAAFDEPAYAAGQSCGPWRYVGCCSPSQSKQRRDCQFGCCEFWTDEPKCVSPCLQ